MILALKEKIDFEWFLQSFANKGLPSSNGNVYSIILNTIPVTEQNEQMFQKLNVLLIQLTN